MASTRTIQSPGVEIREIDLSTRAITPVGTNVLVTGFAPQGPTYEVVELNSLSDFQNVFGTPTNAAERYFYYSVNQLFNAGGNPIIKAIRLPYGTGAGEGISSNYSALAFPVIPLPVSVATNPLVNTLAGALTAFNASTLQLSAAAGYYFGEPALVSITADQYNSISQSGIPWSSTGGLSSASLSSFVVSGANAVTNLGNAGLVVINTAKTTINENFQGYYLNLADSWSNNPSTPFDDAVNVYTIGASYFVDGNQAADSSYTIIPSPRIGFTLSAPASSSVTCLSHDIENIPTYNIAASGYGDSAIISLFKLRPSPFSQNTTQLQYVLQEGYTGSFYVNRTIQDVNGGVPQSSFLQTSINNASNNIEVYINPYISNNVNWLDSNGNSTKLVRTYKTTTGIDNDQQGYNTYGPYLSAAFASAVLFKPVNNLYALGVYSNSLPLNGAKAIGIVSQKLQYALNIAENTDVVDIDITVDAGLSTISAVQSLTGANAQFDDTAVNADLTAQLNALTTSDGSVVSNNLITGWQTVTNMFVQFASQVRKDHYFISDPLRHIFVTGPNSKTINNKNNNFSQNIYWPLRNLFGGINTSYAATYGNWVLAQDIFTSQSVWLPFSGFAAAMTTASDANNYVWTAPAGLNRGIITGVSDIAINPQQKQRDLLYKVSINPVVYFPNEGFTVFGQKTLLKAPSAFDRINVRRLFLYLEKATNQTMKFFIFEPNTTFTQSRVVNTLTPIFELARNTQGLYDYLLVCNATNNTPAVVDDNTLVTDIYIKPVRTAEFILVNFYATKTSQNFNELL